MAQDCVTAAVRQVLSQWSPQNMGACPAWPHQAATRRSHPRRNSDAAYTASAILPMTPFCNQAGRLGSTRVWLAAGVCPASSCCVCHSNGMAMACTCLLSTLSTCVTYHHHLQEKQHWQTNCCPAQKGMPWDGESQPHSLPLPAALQASQSVMVPHVAATDNLTCSHKWSPAL
jgi:hypothetical protein